MKKLLHIFFRFLLGLSLIGIGIRTMYEVNKLETFVSSTINQIQHKIVKKAFNISPLKEHANKILFFEVFLFISSGLLTIFGYNLGKFNCFLAVAIELLFVHNPYFFREPKHLITASAYLGLFGTVLNF